MGRKAGALRTMVRQSAALRLRFGALQRALRREHLLGQRQRLDAVSGSGGLGFGAPVVQLLVELVRRRRAMRALHSDSVELDEESRVRQGEVFGRQRGVHDLQL